jgi:hypothetical protein
MTFRRNISPPSSRLKRKPRNKLAKPVELNLPTVSAGLLLGLMFDAEDGSDMFLRNAG